MNYPPMAPPVQNRVPQHATRAPVVEGPQSPPIFMGHFGAPSGTQKEKDCGSIVYEVDLKQDYLLEGIHVVPNKVTVMNGAIEGKTVPTIAQRPFNLKIHARFTDDSKDTIEINSNKIHLILSLMIHGGVAWIPIHGPFSRKAINYLAIEGTFHVLSVIIHGLPNNTVASSDKSLLNDLPWPRFYYDAMSLDDDDEDNSNERKKEREGEGEGEGEEEGGAEARMLQMDNAIHDLLQNNAVEKGQGKGLETPNSNSLDKKLRNIIANTPTPTAAGGAAKSKSEEESLDPIEKYDRGYSTW